MANSQVTKPAGEPSSCGVLAPADQLPGQRRVGHDPESLDFDAAQALARSVVAMNGWRRRED
jgi:hypothetical protein